MHAHICTECVVCVMYKLTCLHSININLYFLAFPIPCLYQLAELWPTGYMDNHGIKRGICRAKERRRASHSKNKVRLLQRIRIFNSINEQLCEAYLLSSDGKYLPLLLNFFKKFKSFT